VEDSEARAHHLDTGDIAVVIIYLRFSETLTEWDIVLSIIIQLVKWSGRIQAVAAAVSETLNQRRGPQSGGRPSFGELVKVLKDIITLYHEVDIIMDGMDEMKERIQSIIAETVASTEARVLLTSRPIPLLETRLRKKIGGQLVIVPFTAPPEDMGKFIDKAIEDSLMLADLLEDHDAKQDVKKKIMQRADGMYAYPTVYNPT